MIEKDTGGISQMAVPTDEPMAHMNGSPITDCPSLNGQDQVETNASGQEVKRVPFANGTQADDDSTENEFRYGWFGWTPRRLQRFNKAPWLLVVLCGISSVQSLVVNGYINSSIPAIERRFELSSSASGLIVSINDITCAILVVFVSYIGGRGRKPKWLAWGLIIMGTGSVLFALPHFTSGLYQPSTSSSSILCKNDGGGTAAEPPCGANEGSHSGLSNYLYLFLVAQVLHGIGALPIYTLGVTLLDESVTIKHTGVYNGLFIGFSFLGPAIGFLSGGAFLSLFTDLQTKSVNVTPSDPAWVGAWWIGFVISAFLAYVMAAPMSGYPRELPTTAEIRAKKESQAHVAGHEEEVTRPDFGTKLSDIPKAVKFLFINPTFVCVSVASCAEMLTFSGFTSFLPKILTIQFNLTAGFASMIVGVCTVAAVGGTILGGWLIKRFDLKIRGMLRFCMCCVIACIAFLFIVLLKCPQPRIAGVNTNYYGNEAGLQNTLWSTCNEGCRCNDSSAYNPVCGDENSLQYVDPCYAGCTSASQDRVYFSNCTCLGIGNWTDSTLQATAGDCLVDCGATFPLFLVGFFFVMVSSFLPKISVTNCCLRCVPETQRAFALGINDLLTRVLGWIPGPILFGSIVDASCLLWQDTCGSRGACWLYDRGTLARNLLLIGVGLKGVSLLFFTLSLICYKSTSDDKRDSDQKNKKIRGKSYKRTDSFAEYGATEGAVNAVYDQAVGDGEAT